MAAKKKDLEIIYSLQWKNNKPTSAQQNNGSDKNIIGMYDVPATTLNWEIFKSYLLKNSGMVGEDVKVSYITDSHKEFPIESQTDFQIALYAFRRKARIGDIVNLMLETLNEPPPQLATTSRKTVNGFNGFSGKQQQQQQQHPVKKPRSLNDVETQSESNDFDAPPEWFVLYMNQFKKTVMEEVSATVSGIVSNIKCHQMPQSMSYHHNRKSKVDSTKRIRKLQPLMVESSHDTKDLIKSLKIDGKLERKLEKLEHKTKKIREKKLALFTKSSDSEAGHSNNSKSRSAAASAAATVAPPPPPASTNDRSEDDVLLMNAAIVNQQSIIPHMLGGEIYLHQWEVVNTGKLPWTSKTTLNLTWGSKALKPLDAIISVPYLKPGDSGTIGVRLQVPNEPGLYECYWHFHHKERRFGQWLGCQVIVDDFDLKGNRSVLEANNKVGGAMKALPSSVDNGLIDEAIAQYKYALIQNEHHKEQIIGKDEEEENVSNHALDLVVRDINTRIEDIKLQDPTDTNCSSDSDNQSIVSLPDSDCSKVLPEEFVVVPPIIPDDDQHLFTLDGAALKEFKETNLEQQQQMKISGTQNFDNNNNSGEIDQNGGGVSSRERKNKKDDDSRSSSSSSSSTKSDLVLITLPEDDDQNSDYAYVIVDGQKLPIPKKFIKNEYLEAAEKQTSKPKNEQSTEQLIDLSAFKEVRIVQNIKINEDSNKSEPSMMSHCSATGSTFSEAQEAQQQQQQHNSRLFIFPQNNPGFEVVYPNENLKEMPEHGAQNEAQNGAQNPWSELNIPPNPFTVVEHVPNLQQTPLDQRTLPGYFEAQYEQLRTVEAQPGFMKHHIAQPVEAQPGFPKTHVAQPVEAQPVFLQSHVAQPVEAQPVFLKPDVAQPVLVEESDDLRRPLDQPISEPVAQSANGGTVPPQANVVHTRMLPENLVSGAVNVASSAINTARSVINMIRPQENAGHWSNGHWISTNQESSREGALQALAEMGFWDRDLNATLLARYNDDLSRVVAELVQ